MMRIFFLIAAIVALSACGGVSQAKVQAQCTQILKADLALVRDRAAKTLNVADFCECYTGKASKAGAKTLSTHAAIWTAMTRIGQSIGSDDVDEVFDALEESLRSGDANYGFDSGDLKQFGRFVSGIEREFDRTGGCETE